ncbi:hypothetical protein MTR67_018899 [Solanum verrucosum]|uniref:Uncharacterized protein n=1 Tax=Solanum verrucosum TaxID=315347 RepID=A0AAF0QKI0_SOLVR|nr:hypothetical protein MTR67_018899 [Solanum verrucosum]
MKEVNYYQQARWRIVLAAIWWTVWKERNSVCFEDTTSNMHKIKMNCIVLLYFVCVKLNILIILIQFYRF